MNVLERARLTALIIAASAFGPSRLGSAAPDAFCRAAVGLGGSIVGAQAEIGEEVLRATQAPAADGERAARPPSRPR
jgi:hypothetical protein